MILLIDVSENGSICQPRQNISGPRSIRNTIYPSFVLCPGSVYFNRRYFFIARDASLPLVQPWANTNLRCLLASASMAGGYMDRIRVVLFRLNYFYLQMKHIYIVVGCESLHWFCMQPKAKNRNTWKTQWAGNKKFYAHKIQYCILIRFEIPGYMYLVL